MANEQPEDSPAVDFLRVKVSMSLDFITFTSLILLLKGQPVIDFQPPNFEKVIFFCRGTLL